jgi:hypothetical protein
MIHVRILKRAGDFAENKDVAKDIREQEIMPALEQGEEVTLDFEGVSGATQSFIHALVSEALRKYGGGALERVTFKSCNDTIKQIINIVADYMQEGA